MSELPILIIILFIIAALFRVDFIFYIVYVTLGITFWSRWYTPRALRQLKVERSYNNRAFLGESISIKVVVSNNSRLPVPWLQLNESIAVELRSGKDLKRAFTLGGRSTQTFTYDIRAMRRGYYQLGPGQITAGDLFGFKENRARLQANYLTVYPRIISLTHFSTQAKLPYGTVRSKQRLFRDPSRPIGVRDFQPGDSTRHINWKASAHADQLLVKAYRPAMSLETMILLNLNVDEYSTRQRIDGPEWSISLAASIAAYLMDQRQAVGIASNGVDLLAKLTEKDRGSSIFDEASGRLTMKSRIENIPHLDDDDPTLASLIPSPIQPNNGRGHLMTILETLARLEAAQTIPFSDWSAKAHAYLNWGVTILVISPTGDLFTCRSLHNMARRGFNPILLISEPYADFSAILKRVRPFGFSALHISSERDLRGWLKPVNSFRI